MTRIRLTLLATLIATAASLTACDNAANDPAPDEHVPYSQRVTETINSITVTRSPSAGEHP